MAPTFTIRSPESEKIVEHLKKFGLTFRQDGKRFICVENGHVIEIVDSWRKAEPVLGLYGVD